MLYLGVLFLALENFGQGMLLQSDFAAVLPGGPFWFENKLVKGNGQLKLLNRLSEYSSFSNLKSPA